LPKKSKQKKGIPILARRWRVPCAVQPPDGRKRTRFAQTDFPPLSPADRSAPAASQGDKRKRRLQGLATPVSATASFTPGEPLALRKSDGRSDAGYRIVAAVIRRRRAFANAVVAPADFYVFSLVTFFGRAKKVTRLPAGTGGVEE
jgi:hypothetical protein